jgi:hypothetical protein
MNIIFDTDLSPTIDGKRFTSCFVSDLNATITPREGGRWLLALQYFPEKAKSRSMLIGIAAANLFCVARDDPGSRQTSSMHARGKWRPMSLSAFGRVAVS